MPPNNQHKREILLAKNVAVSNLLYKALHALNQTIQETDELQKMNVSVGRRITTGLVDTIKATKNLPGLLTTAAKQTAIASLEGVKKLGKDTILLSQHMDLSNQKTEALFQALGKTQKLGLVQNKQTEELSKTILESSLRYGIKADDIVTAIEGLEDNLKDLRDLGVAGPLTSFVAELQARVGKPLTNELTKFVDVFSTADLETLGPSILAGIREQKILFQRTRDPKFLENAIRIAAKTYQARLGPDPGS